MFKQISSITLQIIKLKINWWWEEFEKGAASCLIPLSSFTLEFQRGKHLSSDLESGNLACDRNCSKFFISKSKIDIILKRSLPSAVWGSIIS